ncbi:hypothetical protein NC652_037298 [Populus alba x Populus x berolinensis]|nr:hypothetical protein NC652_037298 [Populus alba x Populus x berolinensis]
MAMDGVSGSHHLPELRDHKFHFINGGMERDKKKPILCNACLRLFTSRQVWLTPVKVSSFLETRSCRYLFLHGQSPFPLFSRCSDCDKLMLSELWREYYRLGLP